MKQNSLFLLLNKVYEVVEREIPEKETRIPELLCEYLVVDACGIYVSITEQMVLCAQYSSEEEQFTFADYWLDNKLSIPSCVSYYQDEQTITTVFPDNSWQRTLLLPVKVGNKTVGVMIAGWKQHFPLDSCSAEDFMVLEVIGQLLGNGLFAQSEIDRLQLREKTLERICKQAIDELESNKKQLSRELHDELGQAMTSILLQLKLLQQEQDIEVIYDRLGGLRYITQQTIEDVRRLSMNLRPVVLENLGLVAALEIYIEDYRRYSGIKVNFKRPQLKMRLSDDVENIIFRAVQESLTNVVRHAHATEVFISMQNSDHTLSLQIRDNGRGMNKQDRNSGIGLLGMEERVKLAKGEFKMKSPPQHRTTIHITLPISRRVKK